MNLADLPTDSGQDVSHLPHSALRLGLSLTTAFESHDRIQAPDVASPTTGTNHNRLKVRDPRPTLTLDQIHKEITELDMQATALFSACKLNRALEIAERMMLIADTLGQGYLHACQIYAAQGRQKEVLSMSRSALEKIPDQDLYREPIDMLRQEAVRRLERHVDLVIQLPFEIVHLIFSSWDIKDIVCAASVCKYWRERILQCRFLNLTVSLETDFPGLISETLSLWLDMIGCIVVKDSCYELPMFWESINTGCFRNLKCLNMTVKSAYSADFRKALAQVENTLEELVVKNSGYGWPLFDGIVPGCGEKLRVLQYSGDYDKLESLPGMVPDLDLLSLYICVQDIPIEFCEEIIRRCCRNSVEIKIGYCNPAILWLITAVCPKIRSLSVNNFDVPALTLDDIKQTPKDGAPGLKWFTGQDMSIDDITPVLEVHSRTLENITLEYRYNPPVITRTASIESNIPDMALLIKLSICYYPKEYDSQLAKLIGRCKNLKDLTLGCKDGESPDIVQAVTALVGLEKLRIDGHHNVVTMIPLFQKHAVLGNRSTLWEVQIFYSKNVTEEVLASIGRITTLRRVTLTAPCKVKASGITSFLRMIEKHGNLVSVDLNRFPEKSNETIEILNRINQE